MTFTVALVGGDGAGKTTIAKLLEESLPLPSKYLYMGQSTLSSNVALPTSRLVRFLKLRGYEKAADKSGNPQPRAPSSHYLHYGSKKRSTIWVTVRLLNRLAEAWWRQLLSLSYQLRGYAVIYDRHFLFEAALAAGSRTKRHKPIDRLEYEVLSRCYPKPDLVIFLDAPPEVLYRRKGEATPEYLEHRRRAILEQGKRMANFVRVDANQPLHQVLADVTGRIVEFYAARASTSARDVPSTGESVERDLSHLRR